MNRKAIIVFSSVISVIVFALVAVLFVNMLKDSKPPITPDPQQNTPVQNEDQQAGNSESGTENPPQTNDQTPENQPETNEQTPEKQPETNDQTPEKEPTENKEPTVIDTTTVADYKKLSYLKTATPQVAYQKLNDFLNSKYSILINKQNKVGSDYAPTNLKTPSGSDYKLEQKAADALNAMLKDAKAAGHYDLVFYSGYRTYASQKNKYETRIKKYLDQGYSQKEAEKKAGEYIAPPGSSEHHTGLAADVCSSTIVSKYGYLSDEFDTTKSWKWLSDNCYKYGFILRYTKQDEAITGFSYEPWHFRYIGVENATACTELGLTYEEYYASLLKCRDEAKKLMNE